MRGVRAVGLRGAADWEGRALLLAGLAGLLTRLAGKALALQHSMQVRNRGSFSGPRDNYINFLVEVHVKKTTNILNKLQASVNLKKILSRWARCLHTRISYILFVNY